MKLSKFLARLNSHEIYDANALAKDFKAKTGHNSCWPTYTTEETRATMDRRGLGGNLLNTSPKQQLAWGYIIAVSVAKKYVQNFESTKMGRGSAFWEAIEALQKAGL
jgi:hypothetical protein